jgi:hypothetical protein
MLHRNRKRNTAGFIFPLPVAFGLLGIVSLLLIYMWFDIRIEALGSQIKKLEEKYTVLNKQYQNELWKWQKMTAPANIEFLLAKNNIDMVWPDREKVVKVSTIALAGRALKTKQDTVVQLAKTTK